MKFELEHLRISSRKGSYFQKYLFLISFDIIYIYVIQYGVAECIENQSYRIKSDTFVTANIHAFVF